MKCRHIPTLIFNCRVMYQTPGGKRRLAHYKTQAPTADLAADIALRMLRNDRRRAIGHVIYDEAVQA